MLEYPPIPDPLPSLMQIPSPRYKAEPLEQLKVPEGCTPILCKKGGYILPLDRRGILRTVGELWWDSTWLDGKIVPIKAIWAERGAKYRKPPEFDKRSMCGALTKEGTWCEGPAKKCPLHCGRWAVSRGRACSSQPMSDDLNLCYVHGKRSRKHPDKLKARRIRKTGKIYLSSLRRPLRAIHEAIASLKNGTGMTQEIILYRTLLQSRLSKAQQAGDSGAAWSELAEAANEFARAKSETEQKDILARIFNVIRHGASITRAEADVYAAGRELAMLVKVEAAVRESERQSMTPEQAISFVARVLEIVKLSLSAPEDLPKLTAIRHQIAVKVLGASETIPQ